MDLVRLFYNSIDIEANVLLQHFLHLMGFYVDRVEGGTYNKNVESVADIYIFSDAFFDGVNNRVNIENSEKTILILTEDIEFEKSTFRMLKFIRGQERFFLEGVIEHISDVLDKTECGKAHLLRSSFSWKVQAKKVAQSYMKNQLLKASLFTRCFYEQDDFYQWGIGQYKKFINEIDNIKLKSVDSDYLRYVLLVAKYEANLIAKVNSCQYEYNTDVLLEQVNCLLEEYNENEELHLLRADILFELKENWMEACDHCYA